MGLRESSEPLQVPDVQGECVLDLAFAASAELSCRSGTENLDPMGGTAATPEPTSGGVYTCFCCPDLVCFCPGRETVSRSPSLGFFPVLTTGHGRVPHVCSCLWSSHLYSARLLPCPSCIAHPLWILCSFHGEWAQADYSITKVPLEVTEWKLADR